MRAPVKLPRYPAPAFTSPTERAGVPQMARALASPPLSVARLLDTSGRRGRLGMWGRSPRYGLRSTTLRRARRGLPPLGGHLISGVVWRHEEDGVQTMVANAAAGWQNSPD